MKKVCLLVLCGLIIFTTIGCGTIKGVGEDVSAIGRWMKQGSEAATK